MVKFLCFVLIFAVVLFLGGDSSPRSADLVELELRRDSDYTMTGIMRGD